MTILIGMTEIYRHLKADFIVRNLFNPSFLYKILPGLEPKITDQEGNFVHFQMQLAFPVSKIPLKEVLLPLETDLVLEKKEPDSVSPYIWEFYVSKNTLFLALSGRIRMKMINDQLKLGIYIEEINPRDSQLAALHPRELISYVRNLVRKSMNALEQCNESLIDPRS